MISLSTPAAHRESAGLRRQRHTHTVAASVASTRPRRALARVWLAWCSWQPAHSPPARRTRIKRSLQHRIQVGRVVLLAALARGVLPLVARV